MSSKSSLMEMIKKRVREENRKNAVISFKERRRAGEIIDKYADDFFYLLRDYCIENAVFSVEIEYRRTLFNGVSSYVLTENSGEVTSFNKILNKMLKEWHSTADELDDFVVTLNKIAEYYEFGVRYDYGTEEDILTILEFYVVDVEV